METFSLSSKAKRILNERLEKFQAAEKTMDKAAVKQICEQAKTQSASGPYVYYLRKSEKTKDIFSGTRAIGFWQCPIGTTPNILAMRTHDFRPEPMYLTDEQMELIKKKTPCVIDVWGRI